MIEDNFPSSKKKILNRLEKNRNDTEDKDLLDKYIMDVKQSLVLESKFVGGILPVCVDPETLEPFFLFGVERKSKKLCHFHGCIDPGETHKQGTAREAWEESHGLLGNEIDLWRCLVADNNEYSRTDHLLGKKYLDVLVSQGFMKETDRIAFRKKFLATNKAVKSKAQKETVDVQFVSVNQLFNELQRIIASGMRRIADEDHSKSYPFGLRDVVFDYLISRDTALFGEVITEEEDIEQFPSQIRLPGISEALKRYPPPKQEDKTFRCTLCRAKCRSAFYWCKGTNVRAHVKCALRRTETDENKWRPVAEEELLSEEFLSLPFFETDFLRFLRNSKNYSIPPEELPENSSFLNKKYQVYPGMRSIDQLPDIREEIRQSLEEAFRIGKEVMKPEEKDDIDDKWSRAFSKFK
jgi:8-oxo-dGTP pyrophosphatase MutT (NUDIX family)